MLMQRRTEKRKEKMKTEKLSLMIKMFTCILMALVITLMMKTGVYEALLPEQAEKRTAAIEEVKNLKTLSGTIYDRNGIQLAWTENLNMARNYIDEYAYSDVISKESGGVESIWRDILFVHGKPYKDEQGNTFYRGGDVTLTLDHNLQCRAYELIQAYPDAALVLMNQDGEILAMAESSTFNIRTIGSEYETLKSQEGVLLNSCLYSSLPVGSILKPVWSQLLIQNGWGTFAVHVTGVTVMDGVRIYNSGGVAHGYIGIHDALVRSSNVFFVDAAKYMGQRRVLDGLDAFGAGNLIADESDLAMVAIGQAVYASPVEITALIKAETTGEVIEPYHVKKLEKDGELLLQAKKNLNGTTGIDAVSRSLVNRYMHDAAESYGMTAELCGTEVCAKTGTAEYEVNGYKKHIATITAAWPQAEPEYFMTVQLRNTDQYGSALAETAVSMIRETLSYDSNLTM